MYKKIITAAKRWKAIPNTHGNYLVSDDGKVASLRSKKFLKLQLSHGYLYAHIKINKKRFNLRVNRLVALAFIPNPHNYKEVNHIDGCKTNNCVKNLEWTTRSLNMIHAYKLKQNKKNKI